jgi:hypothetical protein
LKRTYILALFFLAFVFNSCGGKNKIVGEWTLMDIDYTEHLKNIDPILKESFIDAMDRQSANILNKTFFKFEEPDVFTITSPKFDGTIATNLGRWAMNDAKDSIVIENGELESYAVFYTEDNTLLFHSGEKPFRILTLVKK